MADSVKLKRAAQRSHFKRRAHERLGYAISSVEVASIRRQILSGNAEFITSPNARLKIWRVSVCSRKMVVVYDIETDELVTMLSESVWQGQTMSKTPHVAESVALRTALADTPAGKVLASLKKGED